MKQDSLPKDVVDELLTVADSKFVLGHWYIHCMPNGRSLPDFCALGALVQQALGHTRAIYELVSAGDREEHRRLELWRDPEDIHSMQVLDSPPLSWPDFIVTTYLVEQALGELLETFGGGPNERLSGLVRRVRDEQMYQQLYSTGWLQIGADVEAESLDDAFRRRFPLVVSWFGPESSEDPLEASGVRVTPVAEARTAFLDTVGEVINQVGLGVDPAALVELVDPQVWDTKRRRPKGSVLPQGLYGLMKPYSPELLSL